jgi:hypothetical protein
MKPFGKFALVTLVVGSVAGVAAAVLLTTRMRGVCSSW